MLTTTDLANSYDLPIHHQAGYDPALTDLTTLYCKLLTDVNALRTDPDGLRP